VTLYNNLSFCFHKWISVERLMKSVISRIRTNFASYYHILPIFRFFCGYSKLMSNVGVIRESTQQCHCQAPMSLTYSSRVIVTGLAVSLSVTDESSSAVSLSVTDESGSAVSLSVTDDSGSAVSLSVTDKSGSAVSLSVTDESGSAVSLSASDESDLAVSLSTASCLRGYYIGVKESLK
jgi:hypothetical protein